MHVVVFRVKQYLQKVFDHRCDQQKKKKEPHTSDRDMSTCLLINGCTDYKV